MLQLLLLDQTLQLETHLVEVPDPGNVVLAALPQHLPRVGDDHGAVPQRAAQLVPLQDGGDDHHVVFLG